MRSIRWISVAGLAVATLLGAGCATNPCDPGGSIQMSVRGVVQVQRQTLDPMGNPVGTPITVAFMTLDQSDDAHQLWLSAEPLPIQPAGVVNGCSTRLIFRLDSDGATCQTLQTLTTHVRDQHTGWYTNHSSTLQTYDIRETWEVAPPLPAPPPTTTQGGQ